MNPAAGLPRWDKAILDLRKLEGYCLSPIPARGRHKARVFQRALDLQQADAAWLARPIAGFGWSRRACAKVRPLLDTETKTNERTDREEPAVLDVVALLKAVPAHDLVRGQVGSVVERLDDETLLIEFSDDEGCAYAIAPCPQADLLILHYLPEAA